MENNALANAMMPLSQGHNTSGFGTLVAQQNNLFQVRLNDGLVVNAKVAVSCPYELELKDYVALSHCPQRGYFILHILERQAGSAATLHHPIGIKIKSPSIQFESNRLDMNQKHLSQNSVQAEQHSQDLKVTSDQVHFHARTVEASADTLMQRLKDSVKIIERLEQVKAKDVIHSIKNIFVQRAKQIDMTADGDVKINGDRIHMG